jgi:hypothetical protein
MATELKFATEGHCRITNQNKFKGNSSRNNKSMKEGEIDKQGHILAFRSLKRFLTEPNSVSKTVSLLKSENEFLRQWPQRGLNT